MIRTLIVDDDSLIHVTLRSMIDWEGCGYTVVQDCGSGAQALRYLQDHTVELLITDIKMPGVSGLELMRQLRKNTALFTVEDFSGAAQRFGDNLCLQLEKPMLELARQLRRLQDRVFVRARTPSCYELYYRARDPMEAEETALSVVRQIQGLWHDFMNLDTAAGVSALVPLEDVGRAMERCETLCRLASLRSALRRTHEVCGSQREKKRKNAIQLAKEFMQDNFTNPELMLKTVADYVGFSEKYFSTRFTRECGCTFINYLNDLRIKRAQDLLRQTDMKIYEVSDAVGYSSVEHFHHMFKKKLGISPKDFRTTRE